MKELNKDYESIRCCCGEYLTDIKEALNPYSLCNQCMEKNLNIMFDSILRKKRRNKELEMTQITDKIFLGDQSGSCNYKLLKQKKITHILVCGINLMKFFPRKFKYYQIYIDDKDYENIGQYFSETNEFIDQAERVFIHCQAGISRSTSIVIAYLIHKLQISYKRAIEMCRKKRFFV